MTGEEIKLECNQIYAQIKSLEDRLKELRSICKHDRIYLTNYSWRPGSINPAEVCEYCNEFINYISGSIINGEIK